MEDTCVSKVENEKGKSSRVSVSGSKLTTLVPRMIQLRIKQKKISRNRSFNLLKTKKYRQRN